MSPVAPVLAIYNSRMHPICSKVMRLVTRTLNQPLTTQPVLADKSTAIYWVLTNSEASPPKVKAAPSIPLMLSRQINSSFQEANSRLHQIKSNHRLPNFTQYLNAIADLAVKESDTGTAFSPHSQSGQALNRIEGDFRLMVADSRQRSLLLATSAFNHQTWFFAELPEFAGTYVISDQLSCLLPLVKPIVCKTALSFWLAGRPDPNRSLFSNIHQVPQAGMVLLSPEAPPQFGQFWDIDANQCESRSTCSVSEYQQQLWALLNQSVCSTLPKAHDQLSAAFFSQLSGGMDSTSISAIAFQLTNNASDTMHSVSHTYKQTDSCNELDNIRAMTNRYAFQQSHFIELDKYTEYSFADVYPTHPQSPGMVLSPKYHDEAKLMLNADAKLLLTGNGGDEMFWGHSLVYYDRLLAGEWGVINEVIKSAQQLDLSVISALRSVFLSPMKQHLLARLKGSNVEQRIADYVLPSWLTEHARQLTGEAKQRANPFANDKHNLARFARYEGLFQTSTFNSMRSYQAVFDQYGLQTQHPFFNKHIAQFSFKIPQQLHISGQYPKLLLRQTMDKHLPEQVCWNKKKTVFDQHFAKLLKQSQSQIRQLLQHPGLADLGLINNKQVLSAFDRVMASKTPSLHVDLLYAILVQSWYQAHIV